MRTRLVITPLFVVLLSTVSGLESAAMPVALRFTGVVTSVDPELAAGFSIGQTIDGTYSFDAKQPDELAENDALGLYLYNSFDYTIGSYQGSAPIGSILIALHPSAHIYRVQNNRFDEPTMGPPVGGLVPFEANFQLTDAPEPAAFAYDTLPAIPPKLSDFPANRGFRLTFANDASFHNEPVVSVFGEVNSLSVVPEPSSLLIWCGYLSTMYFMKKRWGTSA